MIEQEFIEVLTNIFRFQLIKNNRLGFEFRFENAKYKLRKKRIKDANELLKTLNFEQGYELYNKKSYEVSLSENSNFLYYKEDKIENFDRTNKVNYELSDPSDTYLLTFLKELHNISNTGYTSLLKNRLRGRSFRLDEKLDLFDVLKIIIPRFKTLKISTENDRTRIEFESLTFSFLFNLSFNTDISYLPSSLVDDLNRTIRIGRIRRSKVDEIDFPKRKYENDLILYYQKGISSESIDLQYLSFYHILEHFFEKIYNDELTKSIKNELTKPSFSYKRNKDVQDLIKIIQNKLKYKSEEFHINEPEALQLVLDNFITDFTEIRNELNSYDGTLIDYFKTQEIEFSNGNRVNFDEPKDKILKNLRERIYKTRNSIVHSKETEKNKYLPFKHDKILQKEIFLMRILAEKIIISSSKEI